MKLIFSLILVLSFLSVKSQVGTVVSLGLDSTIIQDSMVVKSILMISDTLIHPLPQRIPIYQIPGYQVFRNMRPGMNGGWWELDYYMDRNKKPLGINIVVWAAKKYE